MKKRRGVIILLFGFAVSLLGAYFLEDASAVSDASLAVFTVVCAFLAASIAFPQLAPVLSGSIITKNLLSEYFKLPRYWLFLSYQGVLALSSFFIFLNYKSRIIPLLCGRFFLFFLVFDFFYGFYYLNDLKSLIQSPGYMLNMYREKTKKILEKSLKKRFDYFTTYILNVRRVGMMTRTNDEKELILNTYDYLLLSLGNIKIPGNNKPNGDDSNRYLLEAWTLLVEGLRDSCILSNEPNSINDKNVEDALEILRVSWDLMIDKKLDRLEYDPFLESVQELAVYGIKRDFRKSPYKALDILNSFALNSVAGLSGKEKTLPIVIPLQAVSARLKEIGKEGVKAHKDDITLQCIAYLARYFGLSNGKDLIFLFDIFVLMASIWESNPLLMANLSPILDIIEEEQIEKALEYGEEYYPVETSHIKRFFKGIGDLANSKNSPFIKKFKEKFKPLLKKI